MAQSQHSTMSDRRVYNPHIEDNSARSIADFCVSLNCKDMDDTRARVVGYLHGGTGAKIRLEPVETVRQRDVQRWTRMANANDLHVHDVSINTSEGYADITAEYKPSVSKVCNPAFVVSQWKNLLWPLILFLVFLKMTGALDIVKTVMSVMSMTSHSL